MFETILVGTDGSPTASVAVDRASELASKFGAKLVIVSAYRPLPDKTIEEERRDAPDDIAWAINRQEHVEATLARAKLQAGALGAVDVVTKAVEGSPSDVLLDTAEQVGASLIVVGSVGLTGAKRFLIGSVPSRIVHHGTVDVLVVRTT